MVTIYDVAKNAGVSLATVSRVMNSPDIVNPITREKVENSMKELGYVPNLIASAMMTKRNRFIGVIIPDVANSFFSNIVRGIQDKCDEYGYCVLSASTDDVPQKEIDFVRLLFSHRVDGMILAASGYRKDEIDSSEFAILKGLPTVLIDREVDGLIAPAVSSDNYNGAYTAVKYLLERGHKKVLYIAGFSDTKTDKDRRAGYLDALKDFNIPWHQEIQGQFRLDTAYTEVNRVFPNCNDKAEYPTAIFAGNDLMAFGAIKALYGKGYRIPEDVSIIGYDNIPFSECMIPALTTVNQPAYEMGNVAADCLMSTILGNETKNLNNAVHLQANLVIRDSVREICH